MLTCQHPTISAYIDLNQRYPFLQFQPQRPGQKVSEHRDTRNRRSLNLDKVARHFTATFHPEPRPWDEARQEPEGSSWAWLLAQFL